MERYKYKNGYYGLWLETEAIDLDEEELASSFMNIKIFIEAKDDIGLNVWTVNYLKAKLNMFMQSKDELLVPPDLIVKSLHINNIRKAVEEYLNEY